MIQPKPDLQNQLVWFSEIIDSTLANEDEHQSDVDIIEDWLKIQTEKIRFLKLKKSELVKSEKENKSQQKDIILVFDGQFKVRYYSGTLNYFLSDAVLHSENIFLPDISDELDADKLTATLSSENEDERKKPLKIYLKTKAGTQIKCHLVFDNKLCNRDEELYVANLVLPESIIRNLPDYQTIMLDSLPDMDIYLLDKDYRFIVSGGKEKERYNLTNQDFIGKRLFDVVDKKFQRGIYPFCNRALSGEATEGEVRYKDDVYYIAATPVIDYDGSAIAGSVFLQNITKDKVLAEQLTKAKEEAQKADKAKSIFIANISHEIRTPLNTIIGFSEQLQKTKLVEEQSKYVSLIKSASDHLLNLVTEVVFLFKLGLGKVFIEKSPFSLNALLDEISELFHVQAAQKNLFFEVVRGDDIPDAIIGDSFRLKQVLMNLLVNAIKYTDSGSVVLSCEVKKQTEYDIEYMFEVADTGIGIKKEDLPFIFDVFEQGNMKVESIRGGAGLGLGICQKVVELLGGKISVKSKLNEGSIFTVTLPFSKTLPEKIKKEDIPFNMNDESLKDKKVLIADDDQHGQMLLSLIMSNFKTEYTLVGDGKEALDELIKNKFDVILLDIHMPRMNGLEVIREIRSDNTNKNFKTPALSVTANALKSDIHNYMKAGFDDYLIKPYKEQELYNKICNLLAIEPSEIVEKSKNTEEEEEIVADKFNTTELLNVSNGEKEFFNSMIDNFISNTMNLIEGFEVNLKSKAWNEIGEQAHKSIPSFKYFGLSGTVALLMRLEVLALREKDYSPIPYLVSKISESVKLIIEEAEKEKME